MIVQLVSVAVVCAVVSCIMAFASWRFRKAAAAQQLERDEKLAHCETLSLEPAKRPVLLNLVK